MNIFRIGIIGAGAIVETNHIPALQSLPAVSIAWIYDKNPRRMELLSKMYGINALVESPLESGLEQTDGCLLATPYGTRKPYISECRRLEKALIVEKPFAFSREEHLAHNQGFKPWDIAVNFQRRYYRSVSMLRNIIQQNLFGRLKAITFMQGNFTLKGGSGYLSSAELAGGGVIAESASHILDIILSVTAATAIELTSIRSLYKDGLDYDTIFDSELTMENSKVAVHCEISTLRNLSNGLYLEFEQTFLTCDLSPDGKIFLRQTEKGRVEFSLDQEGLTEGLPGQATTISQAFLIFWQQFVKGWQEKNPNLTSAADSLLTSCWMEGIYRKIRLT